MACASSVHCGIRLGGCIRVPAQPWKSPSGDLLGWTNALGSSLKASDVPLALGSDPILAIAGCVLQTRRCTGFVCASAGSSTSCMQVLDNQNGLQLWPLCPCYPGNGRCNARLSCCFHQPLPVPPKLHITILSNCAHMQRCLALLLAQAEPASPAASAGHSCGGRDAASRQTGSPAASPSRQSGRQQQEQPQQQAASQQPAAATAAQQQGASQDRMATPQQRSRERGGKAAASSATDAADAAGTSDGPDAAAGGSGGAPAGGSGGATRGATQRAPVSPSRRTRFAHIVSHPHSLFTL